MKKGMILLLAVLVLLVGFVGCGEKVEATTETGTQTETKTETTTETKKEETTTETKTELTGSISIIGSTSVAPLAQELADAFTAQNPSVKVEIQAVGSTAGVKAAKDQTGEIGIASRELKKEEAEWGLTEHIIAYDGIAVVIYPSNGVSDLSQEQIQGIFKGEIKNWNEVGGIDQEILVVSREDGSGTRGAFEEIVGLLEKVEINGEKKEVSQVREDALIADGNGVVMANIASKENAIGYVSLSYVDETVKAVQVEGQDATVENIKAGTYKVSRPFLMLTNGEMNQVTKAYMDFVFSTEGQEIVSHKNISVK